MNPPKERKAQFDWVQYESLAFHPTFFGCWILLHSLLNNGRCFLNKFLNALRLKFKAKDHVPTWWPRFGQPRRSPPWLGANFQTIKLFYWLSFNQWYFWFLYFRSNFSMRRDRTWKSSSFTWMLVYRKSTRLWIRWRINVVRKLGFVRNFQWLTALSGCYLCRDTGLCRFNTLYYAFFAFLFIGGRATEEFIAQESRTGGQECLSQSETQTDGEKKIHCLLRR